MRQRVLRRLGTAAAAVIAMMWVPVAAAAPAGEWRCEAARTWVQDHCPGARRCATWRARRRIFVPRCPITLPPCRSRRCPSDHAATPPPIPSRASRSIRNTGCSLTARTVIKRG